MNEIMEKEIDIEDMIYEANGVEVMLDSDLAKLYHVETKRVNEAVKNNPEKFPRRYLIKITEDKYQTLKSKFSTSKGGSRKGHTAFTEQGVYMLATILKSKEAIQTSIRIMDTFVKMRHYINYNNELLPRRFIIIDRKKMYLCGASIKDAGKKCFGIFENNDKDYLNRLLDIINV